MAVAEDYQQVVSAQIDRDTRIIRAETYRKQNLLRADTETVSEHSKALQDSLLRRAAAVGEARAFEGLREVVRSDEALYLFRRRQRGTGAEFTGSGSADHRPSTRTTRSSVVDHRINQLRMFVGAIAIFSILYAACATLVKEGEALLVINLGQSSRVLEDPGLHWKIPWPIERTARIDMRRRSLQTKHTEMLTRDKKNVVLLSYVVWSVEDPLRFYQAIEDMDLADDKINGLVTNAKIGVLGKHDLSALASTDPATIKIEEIEKELLDLTQEVASQKYGIEIHSIGFSRLSLPKENIKAVFKQMRAERRQYAVEFQADGEKKAGHIRSETDLRVSEIRARTTEEVATIRGQAEADAARIYAKAHSKDPDFYRFIRSLETIDEVIGARSTIILRTDSEPFKLLANPE